MDKTTLEAVIKGCGWPGAWDDQIEGLLAKLNFLARKGRYRKLLANIGTANDRSNLIASVLEATIAYQSELAGVELDYEIKQDPSDATSIDFRWKDASRETMYIEARLLQQDKATSESIEAQLEASDMWAVSKDGEEEREDVIRVQQVVLEKVQRKDGTRRKFLTQVPNNINLVAVDVSEVILGTFDFYDCLLVGRGDVAVDPIHQREIFGLFQEVRENDPDRFKYLAKSYSHIKKTLHGILFLFRRPKEELFNFSLEHILICNPSLVDLDTARRIVDRIRTTMPLYRK